jgi:N-acetylmuramoyl-L-alanine amidase
MKKIIRYRTAKFIITLVLILMISRAAVPIAVAGSISLKFEDNLTNMESLADKPAILLAVHAAARLCNIDFQWDPVQEQMTLSRNGTRTTLVLGNCHALVTAESTPASSLLRPLSRQPAILRGAVALAPQDIALLFKDLLPSMDVSWDEAKCTIEVKRNIPEVSRGAADFELKTVVIDPGHGGFDPGTLKKGVQEKQVVLDISMKLAKLIESKSNWRVILTRNSDKFIKLQRRTEMAAKYPADSTLFISIHCNSDPTSLGRGIETFVFDMKATDAAAAALAERENANVEMDLTYILNYCYHVGNEPYSLALAKKIQSSLVGELKLKNRGIKRAPFYVLAGTKMPAVLIELGFISNFYDRQKLQSASFRQSAAEALFDAIKSFDRANTKSLVKADMR